MRNTHIVSHILLIMGFDCWIVLVHKNIILRWCELESDSLVNSQILSESNDQKWYASYSIAEI